MKGAAVLMAAAAAGLALAAAAEEAKPSGFDIRLPVVEVVDVADFKVKTYPGRVVPVAQVNIVPQVSGEILEVGFENGSVVKEGDVLYVLDSVKYEAAVKSALASVEQSEAAVSKAKADLDYCTIRSPVNGVVIARKVDEGETVVSSMNAVPVLTIAEDLKTIWIEATVPEADVGDIKVGQEVTFTADAYRRRFKGKVRQIRLAATTTNNVVTYPIIIEADNPGEMLFPGMTATLSIETARAENAVVVSAAAFRFRPKDSDRASGEAPRGRKIWLVGPDGKLSARAVSEGVTDGSFTQILDADDLEGSQAVAGYETARTAAAASGDTRNPFMPKMPRRGTSGTAPEPKK